MLHLGKKFAGLSAFASLLVFFVNCADVDEPKKELEVHEAENIKATQERPIHLSVDAMLVADPAFIAPLPVPAVPIEPLLPPPIPGPIMPPLPPFPPIPAPAPFLFETRLVPPHQASIVSGRGQLPSRHGNRTFLYSFEVDADAVHHHHRHHHHH